MRPYLKNRKTKNTESNRRNIWCYLPLSFTHAWQEHTQHASASSLSPQNRSQWESGRGPQKLQVLKSASFLLDHDLKRAVVRHWLACGTASLWDSQPVGLVVPTSWSWQWGQQTRANTMANLRAAGQGDCDWNEGKQLYPTCRSQCAQLQPQPQSKCGPRNSRLKFKIETPISTWNSTIFKC